MLNIFHTAADLPQVAPLNSIVNADCFDVFDKIAAESIDMIFVDMPYGTTACKWDNILPFADVWSNVLRVIKPRGAIVMTASQPFTSALVMSNPKYFRFEWIWDKVSGANFANVKHQPLKTHENILIFSKLPINTFNPIRQDRTESSLKRVPKGKAHEIKLNKTKDDDAEQYGVGFKRQITGLAADGMKHPVSIQTINKYQKKRYEYKHPTKKPTQLISYFVKTYTNEGDTVLDFCLGSGSTAVACIETGRNFIGIEKDATYFNDICVPRITEAISIQQQKLFT